MIRMGRRQTKRKYLMIVDWHQKVGKLSAEQASQFKQMFRKCVQPDEFVQVNEALTSFVSGIHTATDRHARLVQDDPMWLEDV